jgi:hemerythrin-like domain-containing protein
MKNTIEFLLEQDHESLDQLLKELDAALRKSAHPRAFDLLDLFWARLAVHIRAENLHLFPALDSAPAALFTGKGGLPTLEETRNVLARLRSDHDFFMKELAGMIKAMRKRGIERTTPEEIEHLRESLTGIRKRLEDHNRLEEEQVYTWPALLFDDEMVAALRGQVRRELENLPPRFS